jgi:alpha-1,2-mannosyltransferase
VGSCRNEEDRQRVQSLRDLSKSLKVDDRVDFNINFKFELLLELLAKSAVGIHSMVDEHFGIGVVECMAAGAIMLAHNSAGPKLDIVVPYNDSQPTGFLASSDEEYCECLSVIWKMDKTTRTKMRQAALKHVTKFSQAEFDINFMSAFNDLCLNAFLDEKIKYE